MIIDEPNPDQPEIAQEVPQPPQPLIMDDIVIPSNILHQILEQLTENSVQADEPVNLVHRKDLNSIRFRRKTKPPKPLFNKPYPFILDSESNLELLKNQIYNDFSSLSSMEDDFLIFPSDVSAEVESLKAKIGDALDRYEKIIQKIEGGEEMVVLEAFEKSLQEGMLLFEEEMKAEEEKKKAEEEKKHQEAEK
ncbi:hypothetical protein A2U01_0020947 [Trifolium medium]|uniref:Uncharacterized protein n=1 Tax=Trifolium medium TaxID=97028 RepID=A0A392NJF1_9FABA|nr:hypothetical protein [Trifolium medium]